MGSNVKAIIFDWGRTLHDPETDALFNGVLEMIQELSECYKLVLVSLAKSDSPAGRRKKIEESDIAKYFNLIFVGGDDKDEMYEKALMDLDIVPEEAIIVDDRVMRGIAWGSRRGATTVWFKKGKFSEELPTKETGNPTFIINDSIELRDLLMRIRKEI